MYSWGIKYAIFEDNYPVGQGDAYSIRKIINKSGQTLEEWFPEYAEPRNRFTSYKILNTIYKKFFVDNSSLPYFLSKYYLSCNFYNFLYASSLYIGYYFYYLGCLLIVLVYSHH